jgi:hypothetical protein
MFPILRVACVLILLLTPKDTECVTHLHVRQLHMIRLGKVMQFDGCADRVSETGDIHRDQ